MSSFFNSLRTLAAAASSSRQHGEDTKMRFSVVPYPGDSGFNQWHDAMKMVARLPGGIPQEFRRRLWLTLAERHLQDRGVDWAKMQRFCFNEWTNPDDDELGVQIVKDLHRTGCSLFCGAAAEENQALLKRVLLAYARWNKAVGYCQGFNMLAALILQVMDRSESDAVKVMIHLIEGVLPESYFANNLRGLSVDMAVFRDLLRLRLPALSRHLEQLQHEAGDSATGTSYEPPLTNVFTMQWFLTLFSNCLPQSTVLRVWDLIFLEGNEVLLRTALAIWDGLADRIMAVESADEFYSIMGVLTREMLEFGLMDANNLVKTIVTIAPFPFPELADLRDKYLYNITPWTQTVSTAARRGLRLFYSDDDEDTDEDDEKIAVAAAYGISTVFRSPKRRDSVNRAPSPTATSLSTLSYTCAAPDRDRLALDISALKQQYAKLRERQRQAHIILTAACSRQSLGPSAPMPVAMNHLLLGKSALLSVRGRRLGPLPGAVPPLRSAPQGRILAATTRALHPDKKSHAGETLHWKDATRRRQKKAMDNERPEVPAEGAIDAIEKEAVTEEHNDSPFQDNSGDDDSSSKNSSSSSSSTSTELCDEPDRLSDFDSEEPTSISDTSSCIPPPDNLLKIPSPSTDISSSPSPDICPPAAAFSSQPLPMDAGLVTTTVAEEMTAPNNLPVAITKLYTRVQETYYSTIEEDKSLSPSPGMQDIVTHTTEGLPVPCVCIEDADMLQVGDTPSQSQACTDNDGKINSPLETVVPEQRHHIYHKSMHGLTNIMNEISNSSEVGDISPGEKISVDEHYIKRDINFNSPTSTISHDYYCNQLISTSPSEGTECLSNSEMYSVHSSVMNNLENEKHEICDGPNAESSLIPSQTLNEADCLQYVTSSIHSTPKECPIAQETDNYEFDNRHSYESQKSVDLSNISEKFFESSVCTSDTVREDNYEQIAEGVQFVQSDNDRTHVPTTVVIQSSSADNLNGMGENLPSDIGRRKSERALKIIQENFEILQRITQCHSRHSDHSQEGETSNGEDGSVSNDMKSSSSDKPVDSLSLTPMKGGISLNTDTQIDVPKSIIDDSNDRPSTEQLSPMTSESGKYEIFNSSYGIKYQTQTSPPAADILEHIDVKTKSLNKLAFKNSDNSEDTVQDELPSQPKILSSMAAWSEIVLPLNDTDEHTTGKSINKGGTQQVSDMGSSYGYFSRNLAGISEERQSKLYCVDDNSYNYSHSENTNTHSNFTMLDHDKKFYSDYFSAASETKPNSKSEIHPSNKLEDKRRSTFDSNDRESLKLFNNTIFKQPEFTPSQSKFPNDSLFEKTLSLTSTSNERVTYNPCEDDLAQLPSKVYAQSASGFDKKSISRTLHNFPVKDDVIKEKQQDTMGTDSYITEKPSSYSFNTRTRYSPECYPSDYVLQDRKSPPKRWSMGALCSDEVTGRYSERADRPGFKAYNNTSPPESCISATAARKSQLTLILRTNEPSRLQPTNQLSDDLSLSRDSNPQTTPLRKPANSVSDESAYVTSSETSLKFRNKSTDSVSPTTVHRPQEIDIKLFPYSSRSSQFKSPPSSPTRGKDLVSSLAPLRSSVLSSPTRTRKKFDPFPPRTSGRQPREIGIKLGLYSATSEADRKNSSKKP